MSYFTERRKANNEARQAAIEARKGVSPFAEYDGGKYEMTQYEENEEKAVTGYFHQHSETTTAQREDAVTA